MKIFSSIVSQGYNSVVNSDVKKPDTPEMDSVVVNGPLSEVYTQALNQLYAIKDPVTGKVAAMESQANDAHVLGELFTALAESSNEYTMDIPKTYVFGMRRDLITPSSMNDLQVNIDEFQEDKGAIRYVLVNDATNNQVLDLPVGEIITNSRIIDSMESMVLAIGGMVVRSFSDVFKKQ